MKKYLLIFLMILSSTCYSQWTLFSVGINNGYVNDLCFGNGNIFAASVNGVYSSSDNGSNWNFSSLLSRNVVHIEYLNGKIIAGTSQNGIFISTNEGISWSNVYSDSIYCIVNGIETMNNKIYASVNGDGLMMSSNYGINWIKIDNDTSISNSSIGSMLTKNNSLYANFGSGGLYKTTSDGENWISCQSGLYTGHANFLASSGNNIFASNLYSIYRSTNDGQSWLSIYNIPPGTALTCLYADSIQVFAYIETKGLIRTTNFGQSWSLDSNIGSLKPPFRKILRIENFLMAGTRNEGIFKSNNVGSNWTNFNNGLHDIWSKKLVSAGNKMFLSSYFPGIFISENNNQWMNININSDIKYYDYIFTYNNFIFAKTLKSNPGFMYRSSDNGQSWNYNDTGFTCMTGYNNNILGARFNRIYISDNNGSTWIYISSLPDNVTSLLSSGNYIFAGTQIYGIYRSSNGGLNWISKSLGFGIEPTINFLISNGTRLYASALNVMYGSVNGLFMSSNYGESWINAGLLNRRYYDLCFYNNNMIASVQEHGIMISTNGGLNWSINNDGLRDWQTVTLSIHDNYVYAGTRNNSVWRRPLSDIIGIEPISQNIPDRFELYQNYPNPFNPTTTIKFVVPMDSRLRRNDNIVLNIYNSLGQLIETQSIASLQPGVYEVEFDGTNFASGVYYYSLVVGDASTSLPHAERTGSTSLIATRKMVLLK